MWVLWFHDNSKEEEKNFVFYLFAGSVYTKYTIEYYEYM